jgi:hypothetical protein
MGALSISEELIERKTDRLNNASRILGIESETIVRRAPSGRIELVDTA